MRKLLFIFCMTAAAMMVSCGKKQPKTPEPVKPTEQVERIDTTATLVMQIQKCSRLYTTEYQVHKIVTHDDDIKLKGKLFSKNYNITLPLGQCMVAIPMEATLKAYVDFAEFSADNVRRDSTHIELILPDPRIVLTSSRIDHNEIKEYVALMRARVPPTPSCPFSDSWATSRRTSPSRSARSSHLRMWRASSAQVL